MEETLWQERDKTYNIYNIYAEKVVLLDVNDRKYVVKGLGQSNIWYGNEEEDRKVETIIGMAVSLWVRYMMHARNKTAKDGHDDRCLSLRHPWQNGL